MPDQGSQTSSTAPDLIPSRTPSKRRPNRKCRSCGRRSTTALRRGQCTDCAGLQPLPLRGEGGRFIQLHSEPTSADINATARRARIAAKGGAA